MTFPSLDFWWDKLTSIISKLNKQNLPDEDIQNLSNNERSKLLKSNLVLFLRHFQHQVVVFFKEIIVDNPLGKVISHAILVEFQVCGSIASSW